VATTSAKLRNQEGNYDMAIELCQQALADNPDDAEAYFQMGIAYSYLDSVGLAYKNFVRATELDPKKKADADNNIQHNFAKHYKLGQSAFNREDYPVAAEEFGFAADADPTQSVAYYNLGVAYARIAREDSTYHALAITELDKVLEMSNPSEANYVKALQVAGRELVEDGRPEEAEERFSRLIEEDPTSYNVIQDIGNDLLNAGEWRGAVIFLKMAADARSRIDADDFTLYYNIGAALYNLRKEDPNAASEAIAYYEKALDLNEDEPQTVFNISVAYVSMEDYANASEWLERYVTLLPADSKGWRLLARCYSETGDRDKAREAMARFEALSG
jgi:tetratricopeptide (TPR) repeat protein